MSSARSKRTVSSARRIRLATDVGGTFTDLVYYTVDTRTGKLRSVETAKAHTTPPNFEKGVMDTLEKSSIDVRDVEFFAHGTTVVINALTERKGVKTGLITTRGFRDVLEIGRGDRPDYFNLRYRKPEAFVPRHLRCEVTERMLHQGDVHEPIRLEELAPILKLFRAEKVEAIAISLLHAYANPEHEQLLLDAIRKGWPAVSVVASHQISREWREYERTNTAVLSAYVQPIARRYLDRLRRKLEAGGFSGSLYIMQSNGGVDTVAAASQTPITMVESGPASGVLGAAVLGRLIGEINIIALDIGGTTAKCSLIDKGRVQVTSKYLIGRSRTSAGYPIMIPVVDIVEIGNGGGSIAWVDGVGRLHVGPRSAGAVPGPVAYGQGGTEPTTTDANLATGRINPEYFLGGEIKADMPRVARAFADLGGKLGISAEEAARGVIRIANNNMVNALKLVSINRGYDPRDFAMIAFGGGGAMHATSVARDLNIPKVIVPANSTVFSAWGMLMSDLRRDYVLTRPGRVDKSAATHIGSTLRRMEAAALKTFRDDDFKASDVRFERLANMRYAGQEHTVSVPLPPGAIDSAAIGEILRRFHDNYEREYTYRLPNEVQIVTFHLVAFGKIEQPPLARLRSTGGSAKAALKGTRTVDMDADGMQRTSIYDRAILGASMKFAGPAIVEEPGGTTVVFPGQRVTVDEYGNLHIRI